jgi:ABC-type cobalt transport system substrate-binding protein
LKAGEKFMSTVSVKATQIIMVVAFVLLIFSANAVAQQAGGHIEIDDFGTDDIETLQRQPEPEPEPVYVPPPQPVYTEPAFDPSSIDYPQNECQQGLFGGAFDDPADVDSDGCRIPVQEAAPDMRVWWKKVDWYFYGEGPCHVSRQTKEIMKYMFLDQRLGRHTQKCKNYVRQQKESHCGHYKFNKDRCEERVEWANISCEMKFREVCDLKID